MEKKKLLISAYRELSSESVDWGKVKENLTEFLTANKN